MGTLDLRDENVTDHLRAVAAAGLGAVVLSGLVEGMSGGERTQLLDLVDTRLAPGGTLLVHCVGREAFEAPGAPPEADLAPGRPLRPETWCYLLEEAGYRAEVRRGAEGIDYLVTAERSVLNPYPPDEQ